MDMDMDTLLSKAKSRCGIAHRTSHIPHHIAAGRGRRSSMNFASNMHRVSVCVCV